MKNFWQQISNIGLNHTNHSSYKRSLIVFNRLSLVIWLSFFFLNLLGELLFGGDSAALKIASISFLTILSWVLNSKGQFLTSRVIYLFMLTPSYFFPYLYFGTNPVYPYLSFNINMALTVQLAQIFLLFDRQKNGQSKWLIPILLLIYVLDIPILQGIFNLETVSWVSYFSLKSGFLMLILLQYFTSYFLTEVQKGFQDLETENEKRYNQIKFELNQLLKESGDPDDNKPNTFNDK